MNTKTLVIASSVALAFQLFVCSQTVSEGTQAEYDEQIRLLEATLAEIKAAVDARENVQSRISALEQELSKLKIQVGLGTTVASAAQEPADPRGKAPTSAAQTNSQHQRDPIGDLNSESIKRGEFDGSIRLPGTHNVSLAIGGIVKAVAIWDNNAEAMGADFLPALLGSQRADTDGAFAIDSTLTRLYMDGRAPVKNGSIRGYVEYDLNDGNNGNNSL